MGPSILGISKIAMCEYWYDYVKPNYGKKTKLCYIDMDSSIFHMKLEDTNAYLVGNVKKRFDTPNYEVKRPLSIGKIKKNQADERWDRRKTMKVFVAQTPKTYSYFTDNGRVSKKAKGTKKCYIKQEVKFEDYKKCQESNKTIIRLQQRFRCDLCNVLTKKVTKIDLSENDDKRFQKLDGVISYPYGTGHICKAEYETPKNKQMKWDKNGRTLEHHSSGVKK